MSDDRFSPQGVALLCVASAARRCADLAAVIAANVADTARETAPGRIENARSLVWAAQQVRRWEAIAEKLGGLTWEELAECMSPPGGYQLTVATVRTNFEESVQDMRDPVDADVDPALLGDTVVGSRLDPDKTGTAAMLDEWLRRRGDLLLDDGPGPVSKALATPARTVMPAQEQE